MIRDNAEAPHRAVLWFQADVYELLSTGECSGKTIHSVQRQPIYVDGDNRDEAIQKLEALIKELKNAC